MDFVGRLNGPLNLFTQYVVMTDAANPADRPFRQARRTDERVRLMGAEMDLVRQEEIWGFVSRKLAAGEKTVVANHNLNSLYQLRRNSEVQQFFALADLVEVDSAPILMWARLTQKKGRSFHRCTYLDWRDSFWPLAVAKGWKVFYLGGAPGVVETASASLLDRYPGLKLVGRDGYFDMTTHGPENAAVLAEIKACAPDVLFVGMGMPRQEIWIARNYDALPTCAVFNVGAAFDYEAGVQKAAPRWMGRLGVEWAFRLLADPKRLFFRYCVEPWALAPHAIKDVIRALLRKTPKDRRKAPRRGERPINPANPGRRAADWRGVGSQPPV